MLWLYEIRNARKTLNPGSNATHTPGLLALDLDHSLVDEDRADELPVDIEPVTQRRQSLDPIPYRYVAPLDERLQSLFDALINELQQ